MEQSFWELICEVNWQLILLTLIGGGILAIVGDRVGMKFAKRRITLFNLRPRYTSSIITGLTGVLISLCVIAVLSVLSDSVRTGMFTMRYIQSQVDDLTRQLQDSRNEQQISSLLIVDARQKLEAKEKELAGLQKQADTLNAESERIRKETDLLLNEKKRLETEKDSLKTHVVALRKTLGKLQEGRIVAFSDERLAQEVIPEGVTSPEVVKRYLERLGERVRFEVARRENVVPSGVEIESDKVSYEEAYNRILAYDSRKVICAVAPENLVAGEKIRIVYRVYESIRVFYKGETLITRILTAAPKREHTEVLLSYMLRNLNHTATECGILSNPLTGTVGALPVNDYYDAIEKISALKVPIRVSVKAAEDIYTEGPVKVYFDIKEETPAAFLLPDAVHENIKDIVPAEEKKTAPENEHSS